jgi:hypothetical protein
MLPLLLSCTSSRVQGSWHGRQGRNSAAECWAGTAGILQTASSQQRTQHLLLAGNRAGTCARSAQPRLSGQHSCCVCSLPAA